MIFANMMCSLIFKLSLKYRHTISVLLRYLQKCSKNVQPIQKIQTKVNTAQTKISVNFNCDIQIEESLFLGCLLAIQTKSILGPLLIFKNFCICTTEFILSKRFVKDRCDECAQKHTTVSPIIRLRDSNQHAPKHCVDINSETNL